MKVAINLAIIERIGSLSLFPKILEELGTRYIELPIRLWQQFQVSNMGIQQDFEIANFSNLLHKTPIFPLSIFAQDILFNEQYELLDEKLEICKSVGCLNMSLGIDPWTDMEESIARKIFIERIKKCASKAERRNIILNLEYISHIVSRNNGDKGKFLFCPSLGAAAELIYDINLPNVKLLLDFLHWYCDGTNMPLSSLNNILGFIHVCDHNETIQAKVSDFQRVLPFEGKLPLKEFLQEIKNCNYAGFTSIEVFRNGSYCPKLSDIKKSLDTVRELLS